MKFIIIIIALIALYFLVKNTKSMKENAKNTNNMILCKMCGYHVSQKDICDTKKEIDKCPNKK